MGSVPGFRLRRALRNRDAGGICNAAQSEIMQALQWGP